MKITDIYTVKFRSKSCIQRDPIGHAHPGPETDSVSTMYVIETDEGVKGYSLPESYYRLNEGAAPEEWARGDVGDVTAGKTAAGTGAGYVETRLKKILVGEDPLCREKIFNILSKMQRMGANAPLSDSLLSQIDKALWDLYGRYVGLPVWKCLGGHREKVLAYASIQVGDHFKGGLSTPEEYAAFAKKCVDEGYPGVKLHTWADEDWSGNNWAGKPDVDKDIAACRAVREAVGPDIDLMLDCFHYYDRYDAYKLGKAIQDLGFIWYEEPMDEFNVESYKWLKSKLDIPIIGPEVAKGKFHTRAEWVKNNVCDILRVGAGDVGGITPMVKTVHLAETFGIPLELHSGGSAPLHIMSMMTVPGKYYERGMLHPFLDYGCPPWLNRPIDPMDEHGFVEVPKLPGLGYDINWDYINEYKL
ncbi:MAG: hypothetical protein IJM50_04910 [Lachnospiraceae bacterium]|nr:hypothetical protein [Lachnospiraceae bacterium]